MGKQRYGLRLSAVSIVLCCALLGLAPSGARAAVLTVTNTNDSGFGSLRQRIAAASAGDIIRFSVTGTITLTSKELVINKNLTIKGPGTANLIISGGFNFRVFHVTAGTVAISGLTIADGAGFPGSGIFNGNYDPNTGETTPGGSVTVSNCTLANNSSQGIFNSGTLTVSDCTIAESVDVGIRNQSGAATIRRCILSNNRSGGILNFNSNSGGTMSIDNCTIAGASDGFFVGGVANLSTGMMTINNSTISDNSTNGGTGGIYNAGTLIVNNSTIAGNSLGGGIIQQDGILTLSNCTVSGNIDRGRAGGITVFGGVLKAVNCTISANSGSSGNAGGVAVFNDNGVGGAAEIGNSIIAGNSIGGNSAATNSDVSGIFASKGFNLIGNGDGSTGFTNGINNDRVGSSSAPLDPKLGPLQDNGGPTQTMALLRGSPAIDAANSVMAPPSDQRNFARTPGPRLRHPRHRRFRVRRYLATGRDAKTLYQ